MADYVPERSQSNYPVERRREAAVPTRSRDDPYTLLVKVVAAGALLGIFGSFCHLVRAPCAGECYSAISQASLPNLPNMRYAKKQG